HARADHLPDAPRRRRALADPHLRRQRPPLRPRRAAAAPHPRRALEPHGRELMRDAALVGLAVIVIRIVWIFPFSYVPWFLWGLSERRDPAPPWQRPAVVSWMGLRGAVTLAAALAVPLTTDAGDPFPDRALIIYLAFAVIVA